MKQQEELHRGLESRHITLMSLGAAIGVGLFLGSASAIKLAGPAILVAYTIAGAVMFLIMRALGEMAIHNPVAGSFSRYAKDHLGPLSGYITGWNYWFLWVVTCMAEITAVGIYMEKWFPNVPNWIWALAALVIMASVNLITAKAYGEFEFWFAMIKIVAIIALIISGLGIIFFGFGNHGIATGISNLWSHGGFAPNGFKGILMSMQMVMFAFLGIEMIGVTAGKSRIRKRYWHGPLTPCSGEFYYSTSVLCLSSCPFIHGMKLGQQEARLCLHLRKLASLKQQVLSTL